jgi:hypothetical protein
MGQTSNREPRRRWGASEPKRARIPCASCGAPARPHSPDLAFCYACLDGARQSNMVEWDDLGTVD